MNGNYLEVFKFGAYGSSSNLKNITYTSLSVKIKLVSMIKLHIIKWNYFLINLN